MDIVDEHDGMDGGQRSSGSSDDFGDFDDEMVDALEIDTHANKPAEKQRIAPVEPSHSTAVLPPQNPSASAVNIGDSDDEFALDEDIFAADMEQVASLYDSRPEVLSQPQQHHVSDDSTSAGAATIVSLVDDHDNGEDDFGDDIDADEFAAAEFAATQAPATTVRK
jgi:DNA replication ATP-dependent helicase Dna2